MPFSFISTFIISYIYEIEYPSIEGFLKLFPSNSSTDLLYFIEMQGILNMSPFFNGISFSFFDFSTISTTYSAFIFSYFFKIKIYSFYCFAWIRTKKLF